jgi:hypothetical protein
MVSAFIHHAAQYGKPIAPYVNKHAEDMPLFLKAAARFNNSIQT